MMIALIIKNEPTSTTARPITSRKPRIQKAPSNNNSTKSRQWSGTCKSDGGLVGKSREIIDPRQAHDPQPQTLVVRPDRCVRAGLRRGTHTGATCVRNLTRGEGHHVKRRSSSAR